MSEEEKWDLEKELGKKYAERPNEKIWHTDKHVERIETDREYKQRTDERNIGLMNGVVLGVVLGLAISLILDSIPKLFGTVPNPYLELIIAISLMFTFYYFFNLMTKQEFEFISKKGFIILLAIIFIMTIITLFGYYLLIKGGIIKV